MSNDDIKRAARAMAESDGFCWENCAQSYWIDHARIAKEALRSRSMEWQPIETAPKDGTRVLVCDEMNDVFIAQYGNEYGAKCWLDESYDCPDLDPKFWQPLPQPATVEQ